MTIKLIYTSVPFCSPGTFPEHLKYKNEPRKADPNYLGMKPGTNKLMNQPGLWPLLNLSCELEKGKHLILTNDKAMFVVPDCFDRY